jgi:hypothetical protein
MDELIRIKDKAKDSSGARFQVQNIVKFESSTRRNA